MRNFEQLEHNQFYHIYNHAVGGLDLFKDPNNYEYFLKLYDKHISPIAITYAWVLMKNHFHLLVRIKKADECLNLTGFQNLSGLKPLHQYFSNLFNAYTKAHNKYHETSGALFERPFKRKLIDGEDYLRKLVLYIHNNPVRHGFCSHPLEYPWSSYLTYISKETSKPEHEAVMGWFEDQTYFKAVHEKEIKREEVEKWWEM